MFWETQEGRSIKQGRKKGEHSLRHTGSFVGGAWQRQGLLCEEELDDSQVHGYSLQPPASPPKKTLMQATVSKECSCFTASALLRHSGKGFSAVWFPSILAGFPCMYL